MYDSEPSELDDEHGDWWQRAIAAQWSADWSDPREDIYTQDDGERIDGDHA